MTLAPIRFDDGESYERGMGGWSRLAGDIFLNWLAPPPGLRWVDIGCGNGVFTDLLIARCAPSETQAIDPSEGQLAFARLRPGTSSAVFQQGDAMALPFADAAFDAAVMALVIFFVPDPAKGVAEMVRVVRPGGLIAAYAWDALAGGLPIALIQDVLRDLGVDSPLPPRADVSPIPALRALWTGAGLEAVETLVIDVQRRFADFDDFWSASMLIGGLGATVAALSAADLDRLKALVRPRLKTEATGEVVCFGRANAVRGRMK
jgi:SAM-dependent methyltransferase